MVPEEGRMAALMALLQINGVNSWSVRLAKAKAAVADDLVALSDLTECDFDGYAEVFDPAFDGPAINGDHQGQSRTDLLVWTAGAGIASPQTIVAVYVVFNFAHVGEQLLMWIPVSPTVTLAAPGEEYSRAVRILTDDLGI